MEERNSALLFVFDSLSIISSMLSTGESGFSTLRNTQILLSSSRGTSNSLCGAGLVDVDGGKDAPVHEFAVEVNFHVAVPLNSSKITSSIRLPCQ